MRYLDELAARRRFGMRPGIETIAALCSRLGNPQFSFPAVHVAGTNGKGAVCALLDSSLRAAGLSVGRYTSPHLVRLNERFFLNGEPADDETLESLSARVAAFAPSDLTFFEALTAVAFLLYAERRVDCAVLECGLGGRLDATNICRATLSVITRIGLDHCDWLGDTLEKIAAEKAGIIRSGVPIVLGRNEPSVCEVVRSRAEEIGAPFFYAPDLIADDEIPLPLALEGAFNRENAQTALAALKVFADGRYLNFAAEGFSRVVWPGRFQRIGSFLVDGAHNPPAAEALAASLESGVKYNLIAGFCGDKDAGRVLEILAPHIVRGFAVRTNNPRSLTAEEAAQKMQIAGIKSEVCPSLDAALSRASERGGQTLVCGSLFLAGEALVKLGGLSASARFDPSELLQGEKA